MPLWCYWEEGWARRDGCPPSIPEYLWLGYRHSLKWFLATKQNMEIPHDKIVYPMGCPVCSHRDGGHPLASWLFQEPGGFDLPWLKSGKFPGWGHAPLEQGITSSRMSKRVLNVRLWQFLQHKGFVFSQDQRYYWSFELKRGFVNRFHVT